MRRPTRPQCLFTRIGRWSTPFAAALTLGCQPALRDGPTTTPSSAPHSTKPAEADLATRTARTELLDDAMRAASSLETAAHRRVRTRLQRDTAAAAIELGMLDLATRYAGRIDDWRRGEVLALVAQAFARSGNRDAARSCLEAAIGMLPSSEDWMRERLTTEIGVAYACLGETDEARRYGALVPSQLTGRVEGELVARLPAEALDPQCDAFDRAIATRSLDIVRSGVDGYFAVLARSADDTSRASRAERAIRAAMSELPPDLQVETTVRLATAIGAAGRPQEAQRDLADAENLFMTLQLDPDTAGPLARDLALGFARAGDAAHARALLLNLLARYERAPGDFVDIERADYLRSLAEALRQAGDREGAVRVWSMALDAGALNPNGRPRAEDLCLTCISLARAGDPISPAMRERIVAIQACLKAPW